jgi:peptidoglycan/LPS O-acetylase OafA/YrhL
LQADFAAQEALDVPKSMSQTPASKYRALDAYRFLAAAMVAIGHLNEGFKLGLETLSPIFSRFGLFVDFFFILSGFVIALNYADRLNDRAQYGDFLWRRISRLWPLHLAVLVFFGAIGLLGHFTGYRFNYPETFALSGLPWNLLLLHAWGTVWHQSFNVASWSISAEFLVYILFPLMVWQVRRRPVVLNLLIVVGLIGLMIAGRNAFGLRPWYQATHDLGALRAIPSFLLGVIIHRAALTSLSKLSLSWPTAHGLFVISLLALHIQAPAELVIALFGIFIVTAIKAEEAQPNTILAGNLGRELGSASYALYMVHMPLMTCGMVIARKTTGLSGLSGWAFATVILCAAVPLSVWLYKNFEDPWRKRINALSPFRSKVRSGLKPQQA